VCFGFLWDLRTITLAVDKLVCGSDWASFPPHYNHYNLFKDSSLVERKKEV
jgi:hypothetical protein